MSKKLSSIIAATIAASTVATTVIPMATFNELDSNVKTKHVETNTQKQMKLSQMTRGAIVYDGITKVTSTERCNPGTLYMARIYDSGSYGSCDYANLNKLRNNSSIDVYQTKMLNDSAELTKVLNHYGFEPTSKLKTELQYSSFRGSGYYYTVLFKYNSPQQIDSAFSSIGVDGYYKLNRLDLQRPNINGTTNFVVNVNKMLTKEEILSHIRAYDDTDGSVPVVIDSATYNPAVKKTGDYNMIVSASDKAGNKTTVTISIKVVDVDKPVITGTKAYTRSYDNPISLEAIKGALSVADNYDTGLTIQLIQDNYTPNKRKVGTHTVTFKAVDSANNTSDVFTVSVTVEDKIKPVITGPTTITVPSNKEFTKEEFKTKFTINDALDGSIALSDGMISGYENYLTNYKKVGNYPVTITVRDKAGNTSTLSVTIKVEDKISPEIWFDDYFIVLEQGQALSQQQIKEYAAKALGVPVSEIAEVNGEYNTNVAGVYKLSVRTIDGQEHKINLSVTESTNNNLREVKWYEYLYKWFTVFFNLEQNYQTTNFFDFGTRCRYIHEIYRTGKIRK